MDVSFYIENGIRCANCLDYIGQRNTDSTPRLCVKCVCTDEDRYKKIAHRYNRYDQKCETVDTKFD